MKNFEDLKILASRLFFPLLVFIGGVFVIMFGFDSQNMEVQESFVQTQRYLIAGIVLILASIVFALYMLNKISNKVNFILSGALLIITVTVLVFNYISLTSRIEFETEKRKRYADTKQRLTDIKEAQLAYKQKYDSLAPNFKILKDFIKNDKMIEVRRRGTVPIRMMTREEMDSLGIPSSEVLKKMNEEYAWRLSKLSPPPSDLKNFIRDTVKVPVKEVVFESDRYAKMRKVNKAKIPFEADKIDKVPYAEDNHEFVMIVKESPKGELMLIKDPKPFDPMDPLALGSLNEKKYNGNWSISR